MTAVPSEHSDECYCSLKFKDSFVPFRDFSPFPSQELPYLHPDAYSDDQFRRPTEEWWADDGQSGVLTFSNPVLNLASRCLRKFAESTATTEWSYVTVPQGARYEKFRRLLAESSDVVFLPFWAWCGDLEQKSDYHLHGIAVAKITDCFREKVWNESNRDDDEQNNNNNNNYVCRKIESVRQLAEILLSLGRTTSDNRRSCCYTTSGQTARRFFINVPVYSNCAFTWILACTYRDGVNDLAKAKVSTLSAYKLTFAANREWTKHCGKWTVPVETVSPFPKNLMLPVNRHFRPAAAPATTPFFLWTTDGEKMYFEEDRELLRLNDENWRKRQFTSGNKFDRILGGEKGWLLPTALQNVINVSSLFLIENSVLKKKNDALKKHYDRYSDNFDMLKEQYDRLSDDFVKIQEKYCRLLEDGCFLKQQDDEKSIQTTRKEEEEEEEKCLICLNKKRNVIFLYCGHIACCESCAKQMETCPICRRTISKTIPFYMS